MSQSSWAKFLGKLGMTPAQAKKRVVTKRSRWGTETEELENRALLSAATSPVDESAAAEVQTISRKKPPVVYPNVIGNWNVVASGGAVGSTTGTAAITQPKPTDVKSNITLDGLGLIQSSGKFTKRSTHEISGNVKIAIPDFGTRTVKLTITFGAGNNPTSFTGTAKIGKIVLANFTGTKQVPIS